MREQHHLIKESREISALERRPNNKELPVSINDYLIDNGNSEEVHLRDYWRNIRKHLWLVIGVVALVTILTAVYMARQPDIFDSQSRVQVGLENAPGSLVPSNQKNSVIVNNTTTDPAYFNTQLQILSSPSLLRRVVKTLDLEHNQAFLKPAEQTSILDNLKRMFGMKVNQNVQNSQSVREDVQVIRNIAEPTQQQDLTEAKRLDAYVRALKTNLVVEPVTEDRSGFNKSTRLIDISFMHPDPQLAAKIVNAIADTFVLYNLERKRETNTSTGTFLQQRIAELQSQIRNGEERLINYSKDNQIISLDDKQNTVVDRLVGLNKQLLEAENDRKIAEAAYRAAQSPGAANALAEADAKRLAEAESKLNDLRTQRAQLIVENTEEWPEVKVINKQIAELEKQANDIRSRATTVLLTNLETRYKAALAREQSLRESFNQQSGLTLNQNAAAINYRILQQEIETNKGLLISLLEGAKENDVVLAGTPNNIFVVDYGLASEIPIAPARLRRILVAFILSLAFGLSLALFLEYLNDTLRSAEDVERLIQLPMLAVIPTAGSLMRGASFLRSKTAALQKLNLDGSPELIINAEARSSLAEAYRQLRTSVLLSTPGRAPKSILVTSSLPSEGKTTTALNTAISLSQTGASVLIIDADMRRPRLHSIIEKSNGKGLSTYLSSEMSEAELFQLIEFNEEIGVHVLTSGPPPPNPAELIGSVHMERLVSLLEANFTHIIIDSPPSASFTDGVIIASLVEGVLLVVHGGRTSRHIVRRTKQILQGAGARIFGIVLNNTKIDTHDYYYHGAYHQYYYHSEPTAGVDTSA
jgi:capsular exopolysaccharide synthesis family protein